MIHTNDNTALFVKGFAQNEDYDVLMDPSQLQGEFIAIVTDMVTTGFINVISAIKNDGKWTLECVDGEFLTLHQEPNVPRELIYGRLVTNFERTPMGDFYDVIFPDEYTAVSQAIPHGDKFYRLVGYTNKKEIATSDLVKLWTDPNGKHHGMTKSGSHYIFNA